MVSFQKIFNWLDGLVETSLASHYCMIGFVFAWSFLLSQFAGSGQEVAFCHRKALDVRRRHLRKHV